MAHEIDASEFTGRDLLKSFEDEVDGDEWVKDKIFTFTGIPFPITITANPTYKQSGQISQPGNGLLCIDNVASTWSKFNDILSDTAFNAQYFKGVSSQGSIESSPAEENKEISAAEVTQSEDKLVDSDVTLENDLLERDQIASDAASVKSTRTSSSSDSSSDSDDEERADTPPPVQIAETKTIPPVKAESSPPTQAETVEEAGKSYQAESASESDQAPSPVPLNEMPPVGSEEAEKNSSSKEEAKLMKKVQITDEAPSRPTAAHPKSARFSEVRKSQNLEPVSSELHVVRYRKTRSAPPRPRGFHAQSSNLVFLHKECERIERKLAQTAKANLVKRPKM
ncbi:uncharacterized protein LOC143451693 [Clavelina lepadiformis]|uniref:uncharacterized protein LOC143451693 n=1 Tax=Clavelina lepadiformis TaxID=159417 RepID=UPI00404202B3